MFNYVSLTKKKPLNITTEHNDSNKNKIMKCGQVSFPLQTIFYFDCVCLKDIYINLGLFSNG